ncbi:MAG: helix-turn-helix domain-containing protein [Flavobacteriales bacterium]
MSGTRKKSAKRVLIRDQEGLDLLGQKLRQIRKLKGFTQEELAFESGLALSQIFRIEKGQINPTASTLFAISRALKISPAELFSFVENQKKK